MTVNTPRAAPPDAKARRAVRTALDTTMLVEAAAGTGKTTSLVGRMVALLADGKCTVSEMAAVTFTRKATAELRARFQVELEQRLRSAEDYQRSNLEDAVNRVEQCFIGTIHSFCARLLRERPVEANVDVGFEELDEHEEFRLRKAAWSECVARLHATEDPLLGELQALGLRAGKLRDAYIKYAEYPDVEEWPAEHIELDEAAVEAAREALHEYGRHMASLAPTFPRNVGRDRLMPLYCEIPRLVRQARSGSLNDLIDVLEYCCSHSGRAVQKNWPKGASQGKTEMLRWQAFIDEHAQPITANRWHRRYGPVLRVLERASREYEALRQERGVLNYQDLLMRAAALLREKPHVREYFRGRFTHLLVDEFQDTDPVQAEVMMLLTADDADQQDWRKCRPADGSLFVVGDPKQSIYRFRRADIVTYNRVRDIIERCGDVVALTTNFRSIELLIQWVNGVSGDLFPTERTEHAPEDRPMQAGRDGAETGELVGVRRLDVPDDRERKETVTAFEADAIARFIRDALDRGLDVPRLAREQTAGVPASVTPGDFLVVTRQRDALAPIARELRNHDIPYEVTGGTAVNVLDEVSLLQTLLAPLVVPDDPVALVGALRSELFGVSDADLYRFSAAGGRFSSRAPHEEIETPVSIALAFEHLRRYDSWLRQIQPLAAIERIAADVGLFARAASRPGGADRAGGLAKAIELLRDAGAEKWSAADLVSYLGDLVEHDEKVTEKHDGLPARPHEGPAVRLMNLHQVKGLEAPIVFLVDGAGKYEPPPDFHVDRAADRVRGFLRIKHRKTTLAQPVDWETREDEEARFEDAERKRLLYVAATRAGCMIVVSHPTGGRVRSKNPWQQLAESIPDNARLDPPAISRPAPPLRPTLPATAPAKAVAEIIARVERSVRPTYEVEKIKEIALKGRRSKVPAGEHGTEWGTVLHTLLEAAMAHPAGDLGPVAAAAVEDQGLSPSFAETAVEVVRAVTESDLWTRAQSSGDCHTEMPLQLLGDDDMILRGVIDLVFRELLGWVIVDYKTDDRGDTPVDELVEHYAPQVRAYAKAWSELTGEPAAEAGLFFVHTRSYRTIEIER